MICTTQLFLQYVALLSLLLSACVLLVFGVADKKDPLVIAGVLCATFALFVYAFICWQTFRKTKRELDARPIIIIRSPEQLGIPTADVGQYPIPGTLYPLSRQEVARQEVAQS
jgi:hypothetical protein